MSITAVFRRDFPSRTVRRSAAAVVWQGAAQGDKRIAYYDGQQAIRDADFVWQEGDILLYDRVFINREHDHIGILLKLEEEKLVVAEGNVGDTNCSGVVRREKDEHIRAIIRIPDGFIYE